MTTSSIPAALTALVGVVKDAVGTVQVIDGAPLQNLQGEWVAVGYDDDNPSVVLTQVLGDAMQRSNHETYDVASVIKSWNGGTDTAKTRTRVYTLLDLIVARLEKDKTLGVPAVQFASLTDSEFTPIQTDKGLVGTLRFVVHVDAWRK